LSRASSAPAADDWTLVLRARKPLLHVDLAELWRYRDLVWLFVKRDFSTAYKQTVLGPVWLLMAPALTTALYGAVFSRVVGVPTGGAPAPVFYLCGIVLWTFFSAAVAGTASTFLVNAPLFGKVYFPRTVIPLSVAGSQGLKLLIHMSLLAAVVVYYAWSGRLALAASRLLWIPIVVLLVAALALGFGMTISALTVKYRDLNVLLQFGLQLWLYVTPIIYPLSIVPARWRAVALANPVAAPVEAFRHAVTSTGQVPLGGLAYSAAAAVVLLVGGTILFNRAAADVVDTI
jgi:lipopolysaccharide transport system permease protein